MKGYHEYIQCVNDAEGFDSELIINTEFGEFTSSAIWSSLQYRFKRRGAIESPTPHEFSTATRKLLIQKDISTVNNKKISQLMSEHYPEGQRYYYVNNYNDSGDGVSVFGQNWDASISINISDHHYIDIKISDAEKIGGFYFFKSSNGCQIVLDEKGFHYAKFHRLNHEQRIAEQFIAFMGGSFESFKIETRYNLSKLFEEMLKGKFGEVTFTDINIQMTRAISEIKTLNGFFSFDAYFDGFERQGALPLIINDFLKKNLKQ